MIQSVMQIDESQLRQKLAKYNFYHAIQLTDTLSTTGSPIADIHKVVQNSLRTVRSLDLQHKRVLDVGCRDGLFCFEAEKMGAREVIGIDNNVSRGAVELLIPYLQSGVRMHELNLLDLAPTAFGKFDVVFCLGVLYHLRYPFYALKLLRDVLEESGQLVLETAILRDNNQHPLLYCPTGGESPYEPSSCTFFNQRGLTDTLKTLGLEVRRVDYLFPRHRPPQSAPERGGQRWLKRLPQLWSVRDRGHDPVTRACFVCQFRRELIDPHLEQYWERTHVFHTARLPNGQPSPAKQTV